ncbi:MAG: flagellar FliJ family protein [Mariprofundaceae bacterium]|nr:flagellar FliJ family protein [Mariprofundaceae bacterium]
MRLLPHQVLKKLAENARNRAQHELTALSRQRQTLHEQRDQAQGHIRELQTQRSQAMRTTVQAGSLLMYEELIDEQKTRILQLENGLEELHNQEQQLLKRWLEHDRKGKAFARIDEKFIAQANRAMDRRLQNISDDRAASRPSKTLAEGISR